MVDFNRQPKPEDITKEILSVFELMEKEMKEKFLHSSRRIQDKSDRFDGKECGDVDVVAAYIAASLTSKHGESIDFGRMMHNIFVSLYKAGYMDGKKDMSPRTVTVNKLKIYDKCLTKMLEAWRKLSYIITSDKVWHSLHEKDIEEFDVANTLKDQVSDSFASTYLHGTKAIKELADQQVAPPREVLQALMLPDYDPRAARVRAGFPEIFYPWKEE